MEIREIDKIKQEIYSCLENRRLNSAFKLLQKLFEGNNMSALKDETDRVKLSYNLMLQYMSHGIMDPQRDDVLQRIISTLYLITDQCVIALKEDSSYDVFYARRRELASKPLHDLVDAWKGTKRKMSLLSSVDEQQQNKSALVQLVEECEKQETAIFNKVWCSYPLSRDDQACVLNLLNDEITSIHFKCLILSALFLGLMTLYDESKLVIISQLYSTSRDTEVQVRSLIYTVLALYLYEKRAKCSSEIQTRVKTMTTLPHFGQDLSTLQFLLARTRNTDNITKRVREDLMPDIMNMSPDLVRKIKDKSAPMDITDLEANPEWQDMLENSGLAKKMEEFNEMQMAGNDVFISTFSHLKSFPFFHTLSNWFLPFRADHSVIYNTLGEGAKAMVEVFADAPLCNSDKYSFCLSLGAIPESQRQMMFNQVQAQHLDLKELKSTELPDVTKHRESVANRHLQDLYRFFKLFSRKREFVPIFDKDLDLTKISMLSGYTCSYNSLSIVAEFYFKNEFFSDAIKYYTQILRDNDSVNPLIFQKLGFSHQNLGNYREALKNYRGYLLAHDNDIWTLKHMAACYKALNRHEKALDCYKQMDAIQPESVSTVINIGNCLLQAGNATEALQYYYKADFLRGAKHRAWRPIAWCSFVTGNDERALNYYDKIINEDKATAQDHMNRGHVLLCTQRVGDAIDSYRKAINIEKDFNDFVDAFFKDSNQLQERGITIEDMALIVDALEA